MADPTGGGNGYRRYASLTQLGTEMVGPILLGLLLDYYFETGPWITVAGAVLGFVGGMFHLLAVLKSRKGPPS